MQNKKFTYIYALVDPRSDEIRYIGKTNDCDRRFKEHLKASMDTGRKLPVQTDAARLAISEGIRFNNHARKIVATGKTKLHASLLQILPETMLDKQFYLDFSRFYGYALRGSI